VSRQLSITAGLQQEGKRLDLVLSEMGCYPSRSAAAHAITDGLVLVEGSVAQKKTIVHAGQTIVYSLVDTTPVPQIGNDIPLDIRYEDDYLIVLSKQINLVCHPTADYPTHTLVNALIHYCGLEHLCDVQGEQDRQGIVHRLDKDTSGLMLAAKTDECGLALMDGIREKIIDRRYLALVHGVIPLDKGLIDAPIGRSSQNRMKMAVVDTPSARDAETSFTVLERFEPTKGNDGYTLVECKLFTGRTHQIRVHMQYIKHPVVGDPLYCAGSPKRPAASLGLDRQFLHSYRLDLEHPITHKQLSFADNLPIDLQEALNMIKNESRGITEYGEEITTLLQQAPIPQLNGYEMW